MNNLIPTGRKRTALSADMSTGWAQLAHRLFLDSLMKSSDWAPGDMAFHGGTSLHLSWQSSRYSEDLDFLLSRSRENMDKVIQRTGKLLQEHFRRLDPAFEVELRDKTKHANRMLNFHVVVSHPQVIGNTMVKAEFWRTEPQYLAGYPTELRTPMAPGDYLGVISYPVPAATLENAFADKLVAFATRPHLKWRDIYDLWWISTQSGAKIDIDSVSTQFLHNITAYNTQGGLPPHEALIGFLARDRAEVIRLADPDLKTWLPADLWRNLNPSGVEQMVDFTRRTLQQVHDHLESQVQAENLRAGAPRA
jgi:predicted nucleotidyltransferase component of viral defense system